MSDTSGTATPGGTTPAVATPGSAATGGAHHSYGTFDARDAVELAVLERSGFVESRHVGSAVVLSPAGDVLRTLGNPHAPIFTRSCLKPLQALAVLDSGVELDAVQTVLATASHDGTPEHVEVVLSILEKAGLTPEALQCPHDWPASSGARDALVRARLGKASVYMNCSGKHAAMLLACVINDWPLETYLEPSHPLQQKIVETVEALTGETIAASGIDGCGAPVHAVSLIGLARGIGRITSATPQSNEHAATLTASVLANGWAIDGPGNANTVCIDQLGVFSKLGAEGVMVMSTTPTTPSPNTDSAGTTVALKILDGNLRAATVVGLALLVSSGALNQQAVEGVLPTLGLTVYGGTALVGSVHVSESLAL